MNTGIDAVNYCHNRSLYQNQLVEAQRRANRNRTTELVLLINRDQCVVDEATISPNCTLNEIAVNQWR